MKTELRTDILVVGGGTGGVAAALAATSAGQNVILTEETDWLGGQLTSQMVPPDENKWIEANGGTLSYRRFRAAVRDFYRNNYPLTPEARTNPTLNPGGGYVSVLCHEPRVAVAAIDQLLAPARSAGLLQTLFFHVPVAVETQGDRCMSVTLRNKLDGSAVVVSAAYVLDATELGDLLPLANVEYTSGAESQRDTGEMHAVNGPAQPDNVQALTWCFPLAYDDRPEANHVIAKPEQYEMWRDYVPSLTPAWPGKLLSWVDCAPMTLNYRNTVLFKREETDSPDPVSGYRREKARWTYRRILDRNNFLPGTMPFDISLINWPQNDYCEGNLIDKDLSAVKRYLYEAKQVSLSLVYWLQTDAPNYTTGSTGYPGLMMVPEVAGTLDGLAKLPYLRESRRIKALFTISEQHVGMEARKDLDGPERFKDSVGIGHYRIDLHMSTGGNNYIDVASYPFQIPLGSLIPQRMENLLPACKNLGVTHITNGCYRLHPVEWNTGESAGYLAAFCKTCKCSPRQVHGDEQLLEKFQIMLKAAGIPLSWPDHVIKACRP